MVLSIFPPVYTVITLLNTAYKIFSNLLFARLQPHTQRVIGNYQCGFKPQRSTVDQIHTLRQILEKTKEYNITTFHLCIDFKAAYDSIKRDKLLKAIDILIEFNIPTKLVNLTKASLSNVRCRVKIQNHLSESLTAERGLRQGDSLACLLFNFAFEKCIRVGGLDRRGTLWKRSLQLLAYADDIDIIGRSERAVKEAFRALEISATDMGLTINEDKTKFMEVPSSTGNYTPFRINGHTFERVSESKYLGTIINDQNMMKAEINNRIKSANKCFFGLKKQLRSRLVSRRPKMRLYKTLILPVLLKKRIAFTFIKWILSYFDNTVDSRLTWIGLSGTTKKRGSADCGHWNVREERILLNPSYCIGLVQPTLSPARLLLDCAENMDEEAVEQWINEDSTLECCEVLSEDDIVPRVTCGSEETRNFEERPESGEENLVTHQKLSHGDALVHTEALLNYLEQEDESTPAEKMILRNLRSIIRRRVNEQQKQTSIISFFRKQ
ncbi:hypothetical protein AVEN_120517-1 [Araneus ventricosus]|uniref:Reverse transcriptase domain-containing protein n=1 Tax=Araneus ventricosus TaxID=182803 RepID=A0A4Y2MQK9_ARAVE|nr:hypothetical protein AVEN_120517-1 [Araneus ventricosus]